MTEVKGKLGKIGNKVKFFNADTILWIVRLVFNEFLRGITSFKLFFFVIKHYFTSFEEF